MASVSNKCGSHAKSRITQPSKTTSSAVKPKILSSVGSTKSVKVSSKIVPPKTSFSVPKRVPKPARKHNRVEVLDPKSIESIPPPKIAIQNETTHIDIGKRISKAVGIPGKVSVKEIEDELVPISIGGSDLNQPRFQSCQTIMSNLENLRALQLDTESLLKIKVQKDKNVQESLKQRVRKHSFNNQLNLTDFVFQMAVCVNVESSEVVFSHLQPLTSNLDQLTLNEELKRLHLAERCAPKRSSRDPELQLSDVVTVDSIPREPSLPSLTFLDQCGQFQIDPFALRTIPGNNTLSSYKYWFE